MDKGETFLDEVKEIIELPEFRADEVEEEDPADIVLDEAVVAQLHDYVRCIQAM